MNEISLMKDFQNVSSEFEAWSYAFIFFAFGILFTIIVWMIAERNEKSYKQGQIDAINGKIHYEKKENENGELVWVEKRNKTK